MSCPRCDVEQRGDKVCDACTAYEHRKRFIDPAGFLRWRAKMYAEMDGLRERGRMMELGADRDESGVCQRCSIPLDEHGLTYTDDPYPVPLCPEPRRPQVHAEE